MMEFFEQADVMKELDKIMDDEFRHLLVHGEMECCIKLRHALTGQFIGTPLENYTMEVLDTHIGSIIYPLMTQKDVNAFIALWQKRVEIQCKRNGVYDKLQEILEKHAKNSLEN